MWICTYTPPYAFMVQLSTGTTLPLPLEVRTSAIYETPEWNPLRNSY
jgi:hypothetical protein